MIHKSSFITPAEASLMTKILDCALRVFGVDRDWYFVNAEGRSAMITDVRHLCFYYMVHYYNLRVEAVGTFFRRHHSTVIYGGRKFEKWLMDHDNPQQERMLMEQRLDTMEALMKGTITEDVADLLEGTREKAEAIVKKEKCRKANQPKVIMRCAFTLGELPMGTFWCEVGDPTSLGTNTAQFKELTREQAMELIEERGLIPVDSSELDNGSELAQLGEAVYDTPDRDYLMTYKDYFKRSGIVQGLKADRKEKREKEVKKERKPYTKRLSCERWAKAGKNKQSQVNQ